MVMNKIKSFFSADEEVVVDEEEEFYSGRDDKAFKETVTPGSKMILIEPRAYSESQQIADHLKNKSAVVVNLKRVTKDQSKRIVDFLSGTIYAIGGDLQQIGDGIFLCTPKNIGVQGKISSNEEIKQSKKSAKEDDFSW